MHVWGDMNFDWEALNDCVDLVYRYRVWGRLGGQVKEKYGSLRWYVTFWDGTLHGLIYPEQPWNQFPKWLRWLDFRVISVLLWPLRPVVRVYQRRVYVWVYWKCLRKHPHIWPEILTCADYSELLPSAGFFPIPPQDRM